MASLVTGSNHCGTFQRWQYSFTNDFLKVLVEASGDMVTREVSWLYVKICFFPFDSLDFFLYKYPGISSSSFSWVLLAINLDSTLKPESLKSAFKFSFIYTYILQFKLAEPWNSFSSWGWLWNWPPSLYLELTDVLRVKAVRGGEWGVGRRWASFSR